MKKIKFTKLKKKSNRLNNSLKKLKNKLWPDEYSSFSIPEVIMLVIISILFGVVVGCILTYSKAFTVDNSSYESELLSTYQKIRDNYSKAFEQALDEKASEEADDDEDEKE